MSKFEDLKTVSQLKTYLDTVLSRKQPKYYYHYTKLSSLVKIYENGNFKAARIKNMNDRLEKDIAGDCPDYFTCLMGSAIESFGMWAMYGGIGAHIEKDNSDVTKDVYVKIKIPVESIKKLIKDSKGSLELRRIAYTNINAQLKNDSNQATIYCGTVKNTNRINCLDSVLKGYIKDNAWSYEKEVRIVSKKDSVDISSVLDSFRIIPSPNNSMQECKIIFRRLKNEINLKINPIFEENEYYNLIMK